MTAYLVDAVDSFPMSTRQAAALLCQLQDYAMQVYGHGQVIMN